MTVSYVPASVLQEIAFACYDDVSNRNDPTAVDRQEMPLLDKLLKNKKSDSGSAGGVTHVLLKTSGGTDVQAWQRRDVLGFSETNIDLKLEYPFVNLHWGLELVHDDLLNMGYAISYNTERNANRPFKRQAADKLNVLCDIVQEKIETLLDDQKVSLDRVLTRDGSYDSKILVGLDSLVSTSASTGTVGGKSRSNPVLQHTVRTGLTTTASGTLFSQMKAAFRAANLNSRGYNAKIDYFMAGSAFIDGYIAWRLNNGWTVNTQANKLGKIDVQINDKDLEFAGIPIVYNPTFDYLDTIESPSIAWSKRCYGVASKALELRTPAGMDMQFTAPDDAPNVRVSRFSLDMRCALVNTIPNAHMLVAIA